MAFDVTNDFRQMSGYARPLKIEVGCWSGTAASETQSVGTRLTHIVGGIIFSHDNACGRPVPGSTNANGTVDFTLSDATGDGGTGVYSVAGW